MRNNSTNNSLYAYILFLLWPFLSLFFAFKNYKENWSENIVWFFVAFYGYSMVISNSEMDANRLVENFYYFQHNVNNIKELKELLESKSDIFMTIFNFLVTRITTNIRVYLFFLGLIFGYFFSRNVWMLLRMKKGNFKLIGLFLFVLFLFVVPFWQINGFRFWTATLVFVFGILNYFLNTNKKYLIWCFSSVLIHFSFLLPIGILILYLVFGNKTWLYYALYFATFFFFQISPKTVNTSVSSFLLPVAIEERIVSYSNEGYVEKRKDLKGKGMNWYAKIGPFTVKYMFFILLSLCFFKFKNYLIKENLFSLFSFGLLFLGIANLFSGVPSGSRFIAVSYLIVIPSLFLAIQNSSFRINSLIRYFSLFSILFYVILMLRIGFDTIGVSTIFGNPIFSAIQNIDVALINLIK